VQVRIRLAAEVRDHIFQVDRQQQHARHGQQRAEPPPPPRDGEPDAEADDGDGGVLAAGQGQPQRDGAPRVAAGIERERGRDDQRDRERLRMNVAQVDAVERRVHDKEERERGGGGDRAEPPLGAAVRGEGARRQHQGLHDQQADRARRRPAERRQEIEHGREVIAPGVHRRKGDVGAVAGREAPDELHVVAQIEGVGPDRQMPCDDDDSHHQGIAAGAQDRDRPGRERGQPERRHQHPERDGDGERIDELVGARERVTGDGQLAHHEHYEQEQSDAGRDRLEEAGRYRHGRRVYLALRLSKRRERRRPR